LGKGAEGAAEVEEAAVEVGLSAWVLRPKGSTAEAARDDLTKSRRDMELAITDPYQVLPDQSMKLM
jgi:hypothetical protein